MTSVVRQLGRVADGVGAAPLDLRFPPATWALVDFSPQPGTSVEIRLRREFGDDTELPDELQLVAGALRRLPRRDEATVLVLEEAPRVLALPGDDWRTGDGPFLLDGSRVWLRVTPDIAADSGYTLGQATSSFREAMLPSDDIRQPDTGPVREATLEWMSQPEHTARMAWFAVRSLPLRGQHGRDLGYSWRAGHNPENKAYAVVSPMSEDVKDLPLEVTFGFYKR